MIRNHGANLFLNAMDKVKNDLNVMIVGEIESYDISTNMAKIIPLHTNNDDENNEYPPLINVPIGYFGIGGFNIMAQPQKGDKVLVLFCDYDIENLLINGTKQNKTTRTHALEDAIAIPITIDFLNNVNNTTQNLMIGNSNNAIKITQNNGIILPYNTSFDGGEGGTTANLQDIQNEISNVSDDLGTLGTDFNNALSDSYMTNIEANTLNKDLTSLINESTNLIDEGNSLGITTEVSNYQNALDSLQTELNNNWINKSSYPIAITAQERINLVTLFANVQTTKTILVAKINTRITENANSYADGTLSDFMNGVYKADKDNFQSQLDGTIDTWFYSGTPILTNAPASEWTDDNAKNAHLGDLYYDTTNNYAYRFALVNEVYQWLPINDTDVATALANASKAQDTADHKRRIFTEVPFPPYDIGDMWAQGSNGDMVICETPKADGESYDESDWVSASKYTDDTTANVAKQAAANAQGDADTANTMLDDMADDGKITPAEKITLKQQWSIVQGEANIATGTIYLQAVKFNVDTTAYENAYNTVYNYIQVNDIFDYMQLISQIDRNLWDTYWKNYYTERTNILNAIANATQNNIDNVSTTVTTTNKNLINLANEVGYDITTNTLTQSGLNKRITTNESSITAMDNQISLKVSSSDYSQFQTQNTINISTAQNNAVNSSKAYTDGQISNVNADIDNLSSDIDNALSDSYITNIEAENLNRDYNALNSESTNLVSQAGTLGITTEKTNYSNALSTLYSSISSFINKSNYPIAITSSQRNTILSALQNVQNTKTTLINTINGKYDSKASGYANTAQTTAITSAKSYTDSEVSNINTTISGLNTDITNALSDSYLTNIEANTLQKDLTSLQNESGSLIIQATALGLGTQANNYSTALSNLSTELNNWINQSSYPMAISSAQRTNIVNLFNTVQSSKTALTSAINSKFDSNAQGYASTAVNNIQIGGRNLLIDSNFNVLNASFWSTRTYAGNTYIISIDNSNRYNNYNSLKIVGNASGSRGSDMQVTTTQNINNGDKIILSFYAKALVNCNLISRLGYGNIDSISSLTTSWQYYSVALDTSTMSQACNLLFCYLDTSTTWWIALPKLEEGNKATDYTQAPEDVQGQIDSTNSDLDNLNTDLSNALSDNYITNIEASSLNKDMNSLQSESTNLVSEATGLGITTEKTNYSNALSALQTAVNPWINQSNYPIAISSSQRSNLVSLFKNVQTAKTALINKISSILSGNAQTNAVSSANGYTNGQIGTVNQTISTIQTNVSNQESSITALQNSITLKVDTSDYTSYQTTVTNSLGTKANQSALNTTNSNVATAQNTANSAATLADSKGEVFTSQPVPPYSVGDIWVSLDGSGDLKTCKTARASGSYVATDWVKGVKYTDDTTANTAIANASAAQTSANNAQSTANTANSSIADMSNDNLLTASEKSLLKKDFDAIVGEKSNIDSQATTYGITTEKTSYDTSYTTLYNYTNPLFTSMSTTSTIVGNTLRSYFSDYYTKKVLLLKKISDLANSLISIAQTGANNAQSTANTGVSNAATAQSTANTAVSNASTAQSTANSKRRVFTSQPTIPYDIGDLWITSATAGQGDLYNCTTARANGSYTASDWVKATKYTDDTTANNVQGNLNTTNSNLTSLTTRTTNAESSITALQDSIALKVAKTDYSSYQTSVNGQLASINTQLTNQESSITALQNSIVLKVTQTDINNSIDNIQVGGRNLALGTDTAVTATGTGSTNQTTSMYSVDFSKVANKQVTLSFDVISSVTSGTFTLQWNASPWGSLCVGNPTVSTTKTHYSFTSTQPSSGSPTALNIRLDNVTGTVTISNLKLEQGNKATDWSPAPEDVQGQIDTTNTNINTINNTTIPNTLSSANSNAQGYANTAKTNAISTASSDATTKANNAISTASSDATTKANNAVTTSKSYTDSQISITNGNIALKVAKTDYTGNTIASLINQSATTVAISASKINLNGYVTVTNLGTAGQTTINGANVQTGTITADKLLIGDMVNYAAWPNKGNSASCPFNGMTIDASTYYSVAASYKLIVGQSGSLKNTIPVMNGDIFLIDFWAKKDSSWNGTANNSKVRVGDQDGNLIGAIPFNTAGTGWTHFSGTVSIGTGDKSISISINNDATAGNVWVDDITIAKQTKGVMIANGSVSCNKLYGGTLTLGGSVNGNGSALIENSDGGKLAQFDNNGISIYQNDGVTVGTQITASGICPYILDFSNFNSFCYISQNDSTSTNKYLDIYNQEGDIQISALNHDIIIGGNVVTPNCGNILSGQYGTTKLSIITGSTPYLQAVNKIDDVEHVYGVVFNVSDISLKYNIADTIEMGLPKINSIKHKQFFWKSDNRFQKLGVIAQDLEQIDPSFILSVPQPDGSVIKQPYEPAIIPYITKSIQEVDAKIEELRNKNIVQTEHYGNKEMYSPRCPKKINWDIGMNTLRNKMCIVNIDVEFLETIDTDMGYQVKPWAYGEGNVWVETYERYPSYFIVRGDTDNLDFGYEIFAKQKENKEVMV